MKKIVNTASIGGLIGLFAGQSFIAGALLRDRKRRIDYFTKNTSRYCRLALKKMNFEVDVIGYDKVDLHKRNFLMVGNHMSYIDVLIVSSVNPSVFVTSVDMQETFFLGQMAEFGGSIFIERRHRNNVENDLSTMTEALKDGFNVMIYPEGTSTNGAQMLPFKKSLLMSAVSAGRDILPVCLKYVSVDGKAFSQENCDKVCWYGDMTFASHFLQAVALQQVRVELHFLKPIEVTPQSTRDELAKKSFDAIAEVYFDGRPPVVGQPRQFPTA